MTSCLVMSKIMQTVLDDVDLYQFMINACHRICLIAGDVNYGRLALFNRSLVEQYINDVIT